MQFSKDSFYMTLRERLAVLNPQRTITLNGVTRPAVVVAENEAVIPVEPLPDAFYIEWGAAKAVARHTGDRALLEMECLISHHTMGTVESGVDRGRVLAILDTELLSICQPQRAPKRDFTHSPALDLGTNVFWTTPELSEVSGVMAKESANSRIRLERKARLRLFFCPEVSFQ